MFGSTQHKWLGILSLLMACQSFAVLSQPHEWVTKSSKCENYLYISGESNVNQFSFRYSKANLPGKYNGSLQDTGIIEISIPIRDLEPSNPMMYGDFLVLMKASEYPMIKVAFSKQQLQSARWDLPETCPYTRITIAGITKAYKIQCSVVNCSENLYLSGEKIIKLSDFQIKPPEKLLGLVKVNNEISVNFGFIITFTDSNPISAKL
jgi:hypothetical protein